MHEMTLCRGCSHTLAEPFKWLQPVTCRDGTSWSGCKECTAAKLYVDRNTLSAAISNQQKRVYGCAASLASLRPAGGRHPISSCRLHC